MQYYIERNANTKKLEELIDSEFEMVIVPVLVDKTSSLLDCYGNVERKVNVSGGRIQYGWSIFQNDIICEAQHHAVWENKQEDLIDITPNNRRSNRTLFIPDDRLVYNGKNIDSIRLNVTDNPVVDDFIVLAEMREEILANTKRVDKNRVRFNSVQAMLHEKYLQIGKDVLLFAMAGHRPPSHCFCNSGKAYQDCHGLGLLDMINTDKVHLPEQVIRLPIQSTR